MRAGRCSVFNMKRISLRRNDIIRYFCDLVILMLFENAEAAGGLRPLGLAVFSALVFSRRNVILLAPMYLAACLLKDFSYVGLVVAVTPAVLFIAAYFVYHKLNRPMHRTTALIVTLLSCVPRVAFSMVNGEIYAPILSSVITLVAAYVLMTALNAVAVRGLRYRLTVDERISLIVAVGMLSLSLFTIKIRNFNLLYPFFAFCLMLSAYAFQGVQGALVTGLSVALGASLQGGSSSVFAVIMITAGVAAAFKNLPEAACAFALTVAFTFSLFFLDTFSGYGYVNVVSIFVGAFSYVLVPRKYKTMLSSSGISYTAVGKSVVNKNRRETSIRLYSLAGVFEDMKNLLSAESGGKTEVSPEAVAYDVASNFCGRCENANNCFRSLGGDTGVILNGVVETSMKKGKATIIDMPPFITSRCKKLNGLIGAVNDRLIKIECAGEQAEEADKNRALLAAEMGGVAEVLDNLGDEFKRPLSFDGRRERRISDELTRRGVDCKEVLVCGEQSDVDVTLVVKKEDADKKAIVEEVSRIMKVRLKKTHESDATDGYAGIVLSPAPRYDFVYGSAGKSRRGNDVSGDVILVKRMSKNRVLFAVGDGMGSGKNANDLSERAVKTIENFFEAGFSEDVVMEVSNKILTRHATGDGFSAVDIMVLNLNTGAVNFIKLGATFTVIKSGDEPEIIEGNALPMGVVENVQPFVTRRVLSENDVAVLLSDGVTDVTTGGEIAEILDEERRINPEVLSSKILDAAVKNGASDDATVLTVKIFSRI